MGQRETGNLGVGGAWTEDKGPGLIPKVEYIIRLGSLGVCVCLLKYNYSHYQTTHFTAPLQYM